jgi:hypothetical protein
MSFRALLLGVSLTALSAAVAARAEAPRDAAELFPAQTLAYLEFRQPDKLSREMAGLLRGSALDDMPAVLAKHREKRGPGGGFFFEEMILGEFGMFVAPETIAEFGRLQGGAVGLTGFNKNMEPEIVGVLLSGTSNAPTFVMRTILTVAGNMRKVDECEGIILYRDMSPDFRKAGPGGGPAPAPEPHGPICAMFREGLIIGSTTDSVKEMIRRLKGKTGDPSLASVAAFRDSAKLRDKPGLFGFADLGALNIQLEETMKNAGAVAQYQWGRIKTLLNPKAGRQATLSLTVQNGTVEFDARLSMEAGETSPFVDLLPDKKANLDSLNFVSKNEGLTFAIALNEGERRWTKALALAEAMQKLDGKRGPGVAKQVEEMEKALKLALGKDVFARMSDLAVLVDPLVLTATGNPVKLMVLTAVDEAAAKAFEEDVLPKVAAVIPPGQGKPVEQTISGRVIRSIPFDMLGPGTRLYYGRQGDSLVFSTINGEVTAGALATGAKKSGLAADAKTAAVLKELGDASIVGILPMHTLLPMIVPEEVGGRFKAVAAGGGGPALPPAPAAVSPFKVKLTRDLAKASESIPPAILALERKPEQIALVIRQANFKAASAKIIDAVVNASLERLLNPGAGGGAPGAELPPPPPAPAKQ